MELKEQCPPRSEIWEVAYHKKGVAKMPKRRLRRLVSHISWCTDCGRTWKNICRTVGLGDDELPAVRKNPHFGLILAYIFERWPKLLPVWLRRSMVDHVRICQHCSMVLSGARARLRLQQGKPAPPTKLEGLEHLRKELMAFEPCSACGGDADDCRRCDGTGVDPASGPPDLSETTTKETP